MNAADRPSLAGRRVLVIEDEAVLSTLLRSVLERAGHTVDDAVDGLSGIRAFHQTRPDLVLLDLNLPTMSGWEVLGRIREMSTVPVIIITGEESEEDKVRGLNAGADDYVTKPFGVNEVTARVGAALRRASTRHESVEQGFADARLQVDFEGRMARWDGAELTLTPTEYRLLATLVRHCNQVLSPGQLLELVWDDPSGDGQDRVKFTISRLRRKLGADPADSPIEAVRGFGYRYRRLDPPPR